jgi:plastocyanin
VIALTPFLLGVLQAHVGSVEGALRAADVRTVDAVVYLVPRDSSEPPPPAEHQLIDQRDLRFAPRVLIVPPGSTVDFLNSDPLLHNVFSPPNPGPGFSLGVYSLGERRSQVFLEEGAHVVLCHIHPEMLAYVIVLPVRLRTATDPEGRFRLDSVPPGRYELRVWHRRLTFPGQQIEVAPDARLHLDLFLSPRRRDRKERDP